MRTVARLHKLWIHRGLYVDRLLVDSGNLPGAYCYMEGSAWWDFADIGWRKDATHDYRFLISRRVLDVLVAERLATFDAVRVWIDKDVGELRKWSAMPEYYAVKVPQELDLSYHEAIGEDGGAYTYWAPVFSDYTGKSFVAVRPRGGTRQILCAPIIAELAAKHKWTNCTMACLSGAGNYYEKSGRRKAERTFSEDKIRHRETLFDEAVIEQDLEAARRSPQGAVIYELNEKARRLPETIEPVEVLVARALSEAGRKAIEPLSSSSTRGEFKVWDFPCKLDVHFQKNVPAVFEDHGGSARFPDSLIENVIFLRDHFGEVWNAFAARINDFIQERALPVPASCVLDNIKFVLYNALVSKSAKWDLEIVVVGVPGSFSARFVGLELLDARLS